VTDRYQAARPLGQVVEDALAGGARWIWLRDRDLHAGERRALAFSLRALTAKFDARLSIGADVELAAEVAADGVHLPAGTDIGAARRRLGKAALIGVSAHGLADACEAAAAGADYVTLSPIFASASKPGYGPALGVEAIRETAREGIAVIALGGVIAPNAAECFAAGASGIAVMGAIMRAGDPAAPISEILAIAHSR
jgi:thiamine-phosphate pyrophosphorylase